MNLKSLPIMVLAWCACAVPAKDAGLVDDDGGGSTGATADSGDSGDATPATTPDDAQALFSIGPDRYVEHLIATDDGVIAVIESLEPSSETAPVTVVGLTAALEPMWEVSLGDAEIYDAAPTPDGGVVLAGFTKSAGGPQIPVAWKLSCCGQLEYEQSYLDGTGSRVLRAAQPLGDGFVVVLQEELPFEATVVWTGPDLVATTSASAIPLWVADASVDAAGDVVLLGLEGDIGPETPAVLVEVSADAVGDGVGLGVGLGLAGRGETLSLLTFDGLELGFRPYEGGMTQTVPIPDFEKGLMVADHTTRYVFAQAWAEGEPLRVGGTIVEFDASGTVLREIMLVPEGPSGSVKATAVALGSDDALYFALDEGDGVSPASTLYRIDAP